MGRVDVFGASTGETQDPTTTSAQVFQIGVIQVGRDFVENLQLTPRKTKKLEPSWNWATGTVELRPIVYGSTSIRPIQFDPGLVYILYVHI